MASTLDHLEKVLADAYRREIDLDENIWRSLPFFAATIALELGAIYQMAGHLPPPGANARTASLCCFGLTGGSCLVALMFLMISICPRWFNYVAAEPDLLNYSLSLDEDELLAARDADGQPLDALVALKHALVRQYAAANHHNRRINQQRVLWRSV